MNFRDLGGYMGDQGMTVRWGRVFRSDSLVAMSAADVQHLRDELGIATIIDLRTTNERTVYGIGVTEHLTVTRHHHSILDETRVVHPDFEKLTMVELYGAMLRAAGTAIGRTLEITADPEAQPLVFHCAAGKDRTGIIAALLLSILGVSDDVIAQDYAHTAQVFPRMITRFIADAQASNDEEEMALFSDPAFIAKISTAEPAMILEALRGLRDDFGSIEGYLLEFGADPGLSKSLRHTLLEHAPA